MDVLRGIAVLLVLFHHMDIIPFLTRRAWIGVDLFFVLSGFLVSGLLFGEYRKRGRLDIRRFLIRRGFKIYPSFYFFLAVTLPASRFFTGAPLWRGSAFSEIAFLQNYLYPFWPHTWSLAVEEHFYILLPLALLGLAAWKRGRPDPFRPLMGLFPAMALVILVLRLANHALVPYTYATHHYPTHLRMDSLLFGTLLAYFHHFHRASTAAWVARRGAVLAALIPLALLPAFVFPEEGMLMNSLGLTSLYLGFGALLMLSLHGGPWVSSQLPGAGWAARGLAAVGFNSYTIYLWHFPALVLARKVGAAAGSASSWIEPPVYLAGSMGLGWAASRLVEGPCLRLRDRWFPRDTGTGGDTGGGFPAEAGQRVSRSA